MNALSLHNVSFAYPGGAELFRGLNLDTPERRVTVLLGPNGSGKSTLLSLLLGYLMPQAGTIALFGKPFSGYTRKELGRLTGFVSQASTLPFNYPVLDYILLGRGSRISLWGTPDAGDVDAALKAAEYAGVGELLERNVQELSAGELQLVSIARALAQEPQILLLDEPTSHLDPANALMVFRLIRRMAARGLSILFTTHDPLHARQVADEAVLLKKGRVLFAGSAAEGLTARNLNLLYGVEFSEARYGVERIPFLGI